MFVYGLRFFEPETPEINPNSFVRAQDRYLVKDGEHFRFKSVSFSNFYYLEIGEAGFDPRTSGHHIEKDFIRIRDMGFNSIRFAFNGNWYKSDPNLFWQWLDTNVAWAAKHGLLLTLDLHVPVGSFWLDPSSDKLDFSIWTDADTRRENVHLWEQIAARYKNSPAIGGFELLNEAVTDDATGRQWRELANDLVSAIREVNQKHLLIVGALYGTGRSYSGMTQDSLFLVDDPNVMYDFHFYEPIAFTHQSASWLERPIEDGGVYPDNKTPIPTGKQVFLSDISIDTQTIPAGTSGWAKYESDWIDLSEPRAVAALPVLIMHSGAQGEVSFDNIEVFERDAGTNETRTILKANLNQSGLQQWWEWGNVGQGAQSGALTRSDLDGVGDTYSLKVSGSTADGEYLGWSSDSNWLRVTPGNSYKISGYMRGRDVSYSDANSTETAFIGPKLNFFANPDSPSEKGFLLRNAEYLEHHFRKLCQFGIDNNVPMSVMEFGTMGNTISDAYIGGGNWLRDMFGIFEKYDTSFSFWNYRSASMGIYRRGFGETVEKPNVPLINILVEELSAGTE